MYVKFLRLKIIASWMENEFFGIIPIIGWFGDELSLNYKGYDRSSFALSL